MITFTFAATILPTHCDPGINYHIKAFMYHVVRDMKPRNQDATKMQPRCNQMQPDAQDIELTQR
eukprot:scaffold5928_cov128-Skeletonema_marinoi.AAC.2